MQSCRMSNHVQEQALDAAYQYVLRNINMSSELNGLYRTDIYELPTDCIREMICNAVAHRSYLHPSSIQVAVYDHRVEVTPPGMLFGSLRLQDIREGISIPRNRALTYAFTYMNIMEHWGSGIPRIIRRYRELGLKDPELLEAAGSFRINLFRFPDKTRFPCPEDSAGNGRGRNIEKRREKEGKLLQAEIIRQDRM